MSRYEKALMDAEVSPAAVRTELEKVLASDKFARAKRLRSLLRFTVAQTLEGNSETLKEYVIGTEVLRKPDNYDPRSDSLVRVLASRLRVKLKEYYNNGGSDDPLVIEFPKGKYVPRFQRREQLQTEVEKKLRARNGYSFAKFIASRLSESTLAEAAGRLEEAIEADPSFASAHTGLASVCALQGVLGFRRPREVWPIVKEHAETALQLDEMSADAHICLGIAYAFFDWRWHDAELHFQKAIERDGCSGGAHFWRALAYLIPVGKAAEAAEEFARAQALVPAPFLEEGNALALYFAGQNQAVLDYAEPSPTSGQLPEWSPLLKACALAEVGRTQEAIELLTPLAESVPAKATLGYVFGIAGQHEKAQEILADLERQRQQGKLIGNYDVALVETGLGKHAEALSFLQEAARDKEPWMPFMSVDPRLSSLRTLPKFTALLRRIGALDINTPETEVQDAVAGSAN